MVKYPNELDTDADIPRVDDNITEIGGEILNDLRAVVFAIEETLGINPHGSSTDLAERLNQSLDSSGNIKASALAAAGIITAPISDADIHASAGIEESKLDLNYSTVQLKTWIDALRVLVTELQAKVAQDIANLTAHTAHPATYGRHRASDVDAYGGVFDGYDVQEVADDLDSRLTAHIVDAEGAHAASAISVDVSRLSSLTADDAQAAIEQLEDLELRNVIRHQDLQHGNGVLSTQETYFGSTNHSSTIIAERAASAASAGDTSVRFAIAPSAQDFAAITRNDRIDLTIGGTTYSFRIRGTSAPLTIHIYGTIPVDGAGTAVVYRNAEETEAPSPLAIAMRNRNLSNRPSTIQVVHPSAAFILGNGFRGSEISASNRYLRIRYLGGDTGDLDLHSAMTAFSAITSTWTPDNVARIINEDLFAPEGSSVAHHPLIAFTYRGQLGVAYDRPGSDGYVEIAAPSAGSGAAAVLGLTEGDDAYSLGPRSFYIDGYEVQGITKLVDAYGIITAADTVTVPNVDLDGAGVRDGAVVRIEEIEGGSYVAHSVNGHDLEFDTFFEHDFSSSINKGVNVVIYADHFSVVFAPSDHTLYELFMRFSDAYGGTAKLAASERATYAGFGGFSATNLNLTAVSRDFRESSRRVFWDASQRTFQLGTPSGSGINAVGPRVEVPGSAEGSDIRLYDGYGTDYLEFRIAASLPAVNGYLDVSISDRISEEHFLQIGTALHDKEDFKFADDRRLFGTVGRFDVRDDFKRDYISYPRSLLRGNGVVRGMAPSGTGSGTLAVAGGEILVDGRIFSLRSSSLEIPQDGSTVYNLFVNGDGIVRLWRDDYFSSGVLATPSTAEILASRDKTMLARITVNGSSVITDIEDLRRFVGRIDDRVDLIVEENDITHGSFASLEAAVNYLERLEGDLPIPRRIRIRGNVNLSSDITVPNHVIIEGDGYGSLDSGGLTYLTSSARLTIHQGVVLRDLSFYRDGTLSNGFVGGGTFDNVRIEGCGFKFASQASGNNAIVCDRMLETRISECRFENVGRGLWTSSFVSNSSVERNVFSGVHQNALYMANTNGFVIDGNAITTETFDSGSDTALMRLESPERTVVSRNALSCTGGASAAQMMLWVETSSRYCHFIENTFVNTDISAAGFEKAVVFDGGGGTGSDHFFDTLRGNVFTEFQGGSSQVIDLTNCNNMVVTGNFIWECRSPFEAYNCKWMNIVDNVFSGVENATVMNIHGTNTTQMKIANNDIENTHSPMSVNEVVLNSGTADHGGVFYGNTISWGALSGTNSKAMVYVDGPEWRVMNNEIRNLADMTGEAPLTLTASADRCLVVYNSLIHTVLAGAPSRIDIQSGADGVVEHYNKGVTYNIPISLTRSAFNQLATSNWAFQLADNESHVTLAASTVTGGSSVNDVVYIEFDRAVVPRGARIKSVDIDVETSASTLYGRVYTFDWNGLPGSGTAVSSEVALAASGTTNVPVSAGLYMGDDTIFLIRVRIALSNGSTVVGVRVNYEF